MGRALRNLDGLLKMPYGCGEQNMAQLAPNIYILQYLEKTQQLTPAVREKAVEFLRSGEGLGSSLCSSAVPLSDPSSVSVLRVSETAELQAPQRRLQHVRSRRGKHLVRTRLEPELAAQLLLQPSSSWPSPCGVQADHLCAAIVRQSGRVRLHRPGKDGRNQAVGGRETARRRLLPDGGKSLQQEDDGEPVVHSQGLLRATGWSPKGD